MDWDRMNFGRVLRELRTQASLSQADLAERIGRDRRRLMALEQGTAVREPKPGEIALLATGLGVPDAMDRLRDAVGTETARATDFYQTVHDSIRADFAGDLSRLLAKLDEVRELARGFSRPAKDVLDAHISPGQLFRAGRGLANVCLDLHRELLDQAQALLNELRHEASMFEATGKRPKAPGTVRSFKERQLRYWSRCDWASVKGQLDPDQEPDVVEQLLDVLETTVFHPHVMVMAVAEAAIAALGHLCLIWAGMALQVEPVRRPATLKMSRTQIHEWNRGEAERQRVALTHLIHALEQFLELPIQKWASLVIYEDWADPLVDNLNLVGYHWGNAEDMANSIITECFDRLKMPSPAIKFGPFAAQVKQAAPSHAI